MENANESFYWTNSGRSLPVSSASVWLLNSKRFYNEYTPRCCVLHSANQVAVVCCLPLAEYRADHQEVALATSMVVKKYFIKKVCIIKSS